MARSSEDAAPPRPAGKSLRPLKRFLPLLGRYRLHVSLAFVALVVAAMATLIIPLAVRRVIDHGFSSGGGTLIDTSTPSGQADYNTLLNWIREGAVCGVSATLCP